MSANNEKSVVRTGVTIKSSEGSVSGSYLHTQKVMSAHIELVTIVPGLLKSEGSVITRRVAG